MSKNCGTCRHWEQKGTEDSGLTTLAGNEKWVYAVGRFPTGRGRMMRYIIPTFLAVILIGHMVVSKMPVTCTRPGLFLEQDRGLIVNPTPAPDRSSEGNLMDVANILTMEATAYTHVAEPGVPDINGDGNGLTALGIPVREGICAVDPTVIPLGSRLYIEGYGEAIAADVGGAIKGNRVDVFMSSREAAIQFGRQTVEVRVVAD